MGVAPLVLDTIQPPYSSLYRADRHIIKNQSVMKTLKEPFPHDDGAPASWQDNQDAEAMEDDLRASRAKLKEYTKMILSTMK